ncbi:MAG TPA: histidine kinase dimerization/phosphoacceptor domain -containing protein, partial [Spirochaetia bacterium]|nr:histidine kinase dimerization/phosphoacceptor domain -containing protein [Spirochaetia bacterium]
MIRKQKALLVESLGSILLEYAFENRYVLHPARLGEIAAALAEDALAFLDAPDPSGAAAMGTQLATQGVGEKSILNLASGLRGFCRRVQLDNPEGGERGRDALAASVEAYTTALLQGYMVADKARVLSDQEQLRRALSAALVSQTEELLVKNHAINTSINAIILSDLHGTVTWVNSSFLQMWGFGGQEIPGLSIGDFWNGEEGKGIVEGVSRSGGWRGQLTARRKDAGTFSVDVTASLIRNEQGDAIGMMTSVVDITEHLKAEEMAKNLLLVKEIHHRIKNNLQVISSLLYLQSGYVQDKRTREMFKESQDRVRSMALLHEKLYQSRSLAGVAFSAYITDLTRNLFQSYGVDSGGTTLELEAADVTLGMDTAVPCGLIINELVTNSLKHAFRSREGGKVVISMKPADPPADPPAGAGSSTDGKWYVLRVSDNGSGFPKDLDFRNTDSLGLKLV